MSAAPTATGDQIARLQRRVVYTLLGLVLLFLALAWGYGATLWLVGVAVLAFAHLPVFVWELAVLRSLCEPGDALKPSWGHILRAALHESVIAQQVFFWRQPFRAAAEADQLAGPAIKPGRPGVLLLHGFVCNRGLWTPWIKELKARGFAVKALSLEPVFGSIDAYADSIDAAVRELQLATGRAPVLLCHSMGGLAARAWLRRYRASERVQRVITLGTPHRGTWLGRFSRTVTGRQMALTSDWLQQLARDEDPALYQRFTCWYAQCDNIVFPVAGATLPGADNRLAAGAVAHLQLAFEPTVRRSVFEILEEAMSPSPAA